MIKLKRKFNSFSSYISQHPNSIFALSLFTCELMSWLTHAISHGNLLDSYFVNDYYNTSMDYFNMISYLDKDDPYTMNANYPPMCFLILKVLYHFIPTPIRGGDGFYYRELMHAQILYIIYSVFLIISIWELLKKSYNGNYLEKTLLATGIVFSGPVLFTLERGNLIFICLPCLLVFTFFYNSDKKSKRWCAYFALAIASSIKLYPALFGLLILQKKRYKEAFQTIILGLFVFIVPCYAFGGVSSITGMLRGIIASSELQSNIGLAYNFSFINLLNIVSVLGGIEIEGATIAKIIVPFLICSIIYILGKEEWKKIYSLSLLCIWLPEFSYAYTLVLMIPPLLSYLKNGSSTFKYLYQFCFLVILLPLCLPKMEYLNPDVKFPLTMPTLVINATICILTIAILIENIARYKYKIKEIMKF